MTFEEFADSLEGIETPVSGGCGNKHTSEIGRAHV